MDIISIYMSYISKLAGHFGQKSGLIGQWPADMDLNISISTLGPKIPAFFGFARSKNEAKSLTI